MIDLKQMGVLIIDDMENMCKSIRGMLKVLNYGSRFRIVSDGVGGSRFEFILPR